MPTNKSGFESVSVPDYLIEEIKEIIKKKPKGLRSHTKGRYVQNAIAEYNDKFKKIIAEQQSRKEHEEIVDK